jgi:hypothetical protein
MTKNHKIITATVIVLVIVSASLAVYFKYFSAPDPSKMDDSQVRAFMKSEDFNSMPRQERWAFMGQLMDSRVNNYYKLPAQDRTKYLDKIIDEMSTMRQNFRPRDPNRGDPNQWRQRAQRNNTPDQRRARRESQDPQQTAMRRAFMNDLRNRMQQRGIQMPGRGFGGGQGRTGAGGGGPRS